jgi:hypothetical protein
MLKKIASIFFLGIFLFNWFGYRVLSSFMEQSANAALITSLDNNQYNEEDLISIKVPSNLPYYTSSEHFPRRDGQIELNGIKYNFVKSRVYKDSIEYRCIPNTASMKLGRAKDKFYKLVNDLQHPSQNKESGSSAGIKNLLSEYYHQLNTWSFPACSIVKSLNLSFYFFSLPNPSRLPAELPPDAC